MYRRRSRARGQARLWAVAGAELMAGTSGSISIVAYLQYIPDIQANNPRHWLLPRQKERPENKKKIE